MTAPLLFLSPRCCFCFSVREEGRGAGVSHHVHARTHAQTHTLARSLLSPSLSLSKNSHESWSARPWERERRVCARARVCVGLMYYCLESEEGLWIDTNSHPRQANPDAGWINVLLFLGAPCFQGRPNDAMTSMRVNRRLEELSGFHLGLLQYFLLKGWKRVQNGSVFPPDRKKTERKSRLHRNLRGKWKMQQRKCSQRHHVATTLRASAVVREVCMKGSSSTARLQDDTCHWLMEYCFLNLFLSNVAFDGQFWLGFFFYFSTRDACACAYRAGATCGVCVLLAVSCFICMFMILFFFSPGGFTQPRPVPGAPSWRRRGNEHLLPPSRARRLCVCLTQRPRRDEFSLLNCRRCFVLLCVEEQLLQTGFVRVTVDRSSATCRRARPAACWMCGHSLSPPPLQTLNCPLNRVGWRGWGGGVLWKFKVYNEEFGVFVSVRAITDF